MLIYWEVLTQQRFHDKMVPRTKTTSEGQAHLLNLASSREKERKLKRSYWLPDLKFKLIAKSDEMPFMKVPCVLLHMHSID